MKKTPRASAPHPLLAALFLSVCLAGLGMLRSERLQGAVPLGGSGTSSGCWIAGPDIDGDGKPDYYEPCPGDDALQGGDIVPVPAPGGSGSGVLPGSSARSSSANSKGDGDDTDDGDDDNQGNDDDRDDDDEGKKDDDEDDEDEAAKELQRLWEEEQKRLEDEAKRIAEEEIRRMEERRKAQETLKQNEEERRRKEAELRKLLDIPELLSTENDVRADDQPAGLTCLDAQGERTTDRSACDPDRTKSLVGGSVLTPEQELILRKTAGERYVGSETLAGRIAAMLDLIEETRARFIALRDAGALSDPAAQEFLQQSIDWLDGAYGYFTSPDRTAEDIALMRTYLQQIIDYTEVLLRNERAARPAPPIDDLLTKTARILGTFPDIFAILQREGVIVDPNAQVTYDTATALLNDIARTCPGDDAQCRRLGEVVGYIESMQTSIQNAITDAGKPELEAVIREAIRVKLAQ